MDDEAMSANIEAVALALLNAYRRGAGSPELQGYGGYSEAVIKPYRATARTLLSAEIGKDAWQAIDHAPKDGTRILAWRADDKDDPYTGTAICTWTTYGGSGRWTVEHDAEGYRWNNYTPTHYMTLPKPPTP